jgi:hypothetical protein
MKYAAALLAFVVMGASAHGQKPPIIVVPITGEERALIDEARKAVADAQAALEVAKQKQLAIENKVMQDKRDKMGIPWANCVGETSSFVGSGFTIVQTNPDDSKGYTAELRGGWVIFTLGYAVCRAM